MWHLLPGSCKPWTWAEYAMKGLKGLREAEKAGYERDTARMERDRLAQQLENQELDEKVLTIAVDTWPNAVKGLGIQTKHLVSDVWLQKTAVALGVDIGKIRESTQRLNAERKFPWQDSRLRF